VGSKILISKTRQLLFIRNKKEMPRIGGKLLLLLFSILTKWMTKIPLVIEKGYYLYQVY
jgi:hypothetical protein